jgi:hypothetical protein
MSRGPGKWERAILEALERVPAFYLTDLLPDPHTRSQTVALNRAMRKLAGAYKIGVKYWWLTIGGGWSGYPRSGFVTIYRVGFPEPERENITRLKSCTGDETFTHATFTERPKRSVVLDDVEWHRVDAK